MIPLEVDKMYHLRAHVDGRADLFYEEKSYDYFLKQCSHYIDPVVDTFAYCLLPEHLDLMVKVRNEERILDYLRDEEGDPTIQDFGYHGGLSNVVNQQFKRLFNQYTKFIKEEYDYGENSFEPDLKWKLVDSAEYFLQLIVYIHNAPVHHELVEHPDEWPYSSWQHLYS